MDIWWRIQTLRSHSLGVRVIFVNRPEFLALTLEVGFWKWLTSISIGTRVRL